MLESHKGQGIYGTVCELMKLTAVLILFVAVVTAAGVYAQEEDLGLIGRYDDVRRIPFNYTKNTNEFVFTRLIYNGQIPGYYKNWYTDYPRADRNLILVLKRLTNIPIADGERAIPINDPDLFNYPLVYSSEVEQMVLTDDDATILGQF
jgi:hypothetical protein